MRILAIDQASLVSGYAVFDDDVLVRSGTVELLEKKDSLKKFKYMVDLLNRLIESVRPDEVILEDVQSQLNPMTFKVLARLQGSLMWCCYKDEIPVTIIGPTEWRKCLGFEQGGRIRRWRLKQQAMDYVKENFGKTVSEDEADAICIGAAILSKKNTERTKKKKK